MFVFFACLFSLVLMFVALKCHDRFDPARYFLLLWGGQIVLVYGIFHNQFIFTGYGLVYIAMMVGVFSMGTLAGQMLGKTIPEKNIESTFNSRRSLLFLQIGLGFGLLNVLQVIQANGFGVSDLFTFKTLLKINATATNMRYTMDEQHDLFSRLTLIFVNLTPLYGGYLVPLLSGKKRIWCYLAILPGLLISLTQAVKLALVTNMVLIVVGIIVSSYANNPSFFKIKLATVGKITLLGISFFAVLFLSMMFRAGKFDAGTVQYMSQKFMTYAFGHLPAFDVWFTDNLGQLDPDGGMKTFYGISNFLGLAVRKQGVFTESIYFWKDVHHLIPSNMSTNVFTVFRFLLEDFGYVGSFLSMLVTGLASGFSWLMVKRQKSALFFQTVLVAFLFFIFMSFATSVWVYTSYIATIVCFYVLVRFTFSKQTA